MKVHNDLKEMLLEFYDWIVTNELYHNIPSRQEQKVDKFLERNSILALGKPEPLAKNKECESNFACINPNWAEGNKRCETQCELCRRCVSQEIA